MSDYALTHFEQHQLALLHAHLQAGGGLAAPFAREIFLIEHRHSSMCERVQQRSIKLPEHGLLCLDGISSTRWGGSILRSCEEPVQHATC